MSIVVYDGYKAKKKKAAGCFALQEKKEDGLDGVRVMWAKTAAFDFI